MNLQFYTNKTPFFTGTNSPQNTQGLTKFIKKHRLSPKDADVILAENPEMSRYLGCTPKNWYKNINEKDIKETDAKVKETLSTFAKMTYDNSEQYDIYPKECAYLEKSLSELLKTPSTVEYIEEGESGKVFCVNVNDKKYALKTFHDLTRCGRRRQGHGMQYEPLDFAFISKNVPSGSNRYTTFYLSKYARENEGDGFILSDYIDSSIKGAKPHKLRAFFEPVFSLDTFGQNNIKGTIYDIGGTTYTYPKYTREKGRILRILCDFINKADIEGYEKFAAKHKNDLAYKKAVSDFSKNISFFYGDKKTNDSLRECDRLSDKQYAVLDEII